MVMPLNIIGIAIQLGWLWHAFDALVMSLNVIAITIRLI
jgi:hypothetical protein